MTLYCCEVLATAADLCKVLSIKERQASRVRASSWNMLDRETVILRQRRGYTFTLKNIDRTSSQQELITHQKMYDYSYEV